jgi:hypothetical protein
MLSRALRMAVLPMAVLPMSSVASSGPARAVVPEAGTQVRVNGVRFELRSLVLEGEPESLARRLDGTWGDRQALPSPSSSRAILGRQRGPFHETLTLSAGPRRGSSRVVVAVQDLRDAPQAPPAVPLPLPTASRVLNVVQFGEPGRAAAAFTVRAPGAPEAALQGFWRAAAARGWQRVASPASADRPGAAFWARRGNQALTVVALPAGAGARVVLLVAEDAAGASR